MPLDDGTDFSRLARYLADECTREERETIERWIDGDPAARAELEAMRRWWTRAAVVPSSTRVDAMWQRLSRRMHGNDVSVVVPDAEPRTAPRPRPRPVAPAFPLMPARTPKVVGWRLPIAIAAGLALATAGSMLWRAPAAVPQRAAQPELREFATARGQRATIRLVDGTRVELGFASTLRVRPFRGGRRELLLEGEAVFDVVHDEARPFIVHAGNAVTEDLGTTFSVRAYPGDSAVRVVVVSGKVAMRPRNAADGSATRSAILLPGQLGRLDARGTVAVESGVDTSAYTAWLSGRLSLHDARLADIAAELERRFDVTIAVRDPATAELRLTVDMQPRTLDEILDAITVPLKLRHRRDGGTIVLER
ncbi:MAG TPA: FecR domain-containing protein [Gemmatimonadaceae bacterium]|nr:FecR domain-containing protein [Gemmatimonadaceae bacterium]